MHYNKRGYSPQKKIYKVDGYFFSEKESWCVIRFRVQPIINSWKPSLYKKGESSAKMGLLKIK